MESFPLYMIRILISEPRKSLNSTPCSSEDPTIHLRSSLFFHSRAAYDGTSEPARFETRGSLRANPSLADSQYRCKSPSLGQEGNILGVAGFLTCLISVLVSR